MDEKAKVATITIDSTAFPDKAILKSTIQKWLTKNSEYKQYDCIKVSNNKRDIIFMILNNQLVCTDDIHNTGDLLDYCPLNHWDELQIIKTPNINLSNYQQQIEDNYHTPHTIRYNVYASWYQNKANIRYSIVIVTKKANKLTKEDFLNNIAIMKKSIYNPNSCADEVNISLKDAGIIDNVCMILDMS